MYQGETLLDEDLARHACPVMIGAVERKLAGLLGDEVEILLFAGLDDELRAVRTQSFGIDDLYHLQESGGGELVQLLAAILDVQAIGRPDAKGQTGRCESVLGLHEYHSLGLRRIR